MTVTDSIKALVDSPELFARVTYRLLKRVTRVEKTLRVIDVSITDDVKELREDIKTIKTIMWGVLCTVIGCLVSAVGCLAMLLYNAIASA